MPNKAGSYFLQPFRFLRNTGRGVHTRKGETGVFNYDLMKAVILVAAGAGIAYFITRNK